MTYRVPAPEPVDGPLTGDDRPMLEGFLRWQRATLLNVCAGLTGEELAQRSVPTSELSLLGLVRHLTKVERIWLRRRVAGQDVPPLFTGTADFDDGRAADAEHEVEALAAEWQLADDAVAGVDWQYEIEVHGAAMSLRMVYLHLIYEYSRHNGHADLLREAIDGVRGR